MLHITNGDSTAISIAESGAGRTVLPWRDVLHEGPIPMGLGVDELREVRARFLADRGWGVYEEVLADFGRRDETLAGFREHDEVVLWFEHDLYDQLQLIQVLDRFVGQVLGSTRLSMICIGEFPGIARFHGLGQLSAEQISSLFPQRQPVTREQLDLGRAAWNAVQSPDPTAVERILVAETGALPFLAGALVRLLEEFPSWREGLSRTERQTLEVLRDGRRTAGELFRAVADREERPFLGDLTYWDRLTSLADCPSPLITSVDGAEGVVPQPGQDPSRMARQPFEATDQGRAVLAGEEDHVVLNGIDRWIGGVRLQGKTVPWRWEAAADSGRLRQVA